VVTRATPATRVCTICRRELPLTAEYFHRHNVSHRGFQYVCKPCKRILIRDRRKADPEKWRLEDQRQYQRLRLAALIHYSDGDPACACCGERTMQFLAIDHIGGHGRQNGGSGRTLYRWLSAHNYPPGFRILCHNCNLAIGWYGSCPHQQPPLAEP
jgi:hypothetical protein